MRRRLAAVMVAAGALGCSATAGAQERVIAEVLRPTPISVHAGNLVFSAWDPSIQRYRLMLSVDGLPAAPVDVPPRTVPFDADVGPGYGQALNAVYSRCRTEPQLERSGNVLPAWNTGAGCDLFRVILATGDERRLRLQSTDQASEYLPSIWRSGIAFARRYEAREGRRGTQPYLYTADALQVRSTRALPRPPRGSGDAAATTGQPIGLDRRGDRVAYVWNHRADGRLVSELRSVTRGGRSTRLSRITGDPGIGELLAPTQETSSTVVGGQAHLGARQHIARYPLGDGEVRRHATAGDRLLLAVTRDHAVLGHRGTYVLDAPGASRSLGAAAQCTGGGDGRCRIVALDDNPLGR